MTGLNKTISTEGIYVEPMTNLGQLIKLELVSKVDYCFSNWELFIRY